MPRNPYSHLSNEMNRAGFLEAGRFESRCHIEGFNGTVKSISCFSRRDILDCLVHATMVESVDPFKRGDLDGFRGQDRTAQPQFSFSRSFVRRT